MAKRATEYILHLDILRWAIERQLLEQRSNELKSHWSKSIERAKARLAAENVVLRAVPETPQPSWPPSPAPQALYSDGETWIELSHALQNLRDRQKQIVDEEIPRAEQVSQEVIADLHKAEERLAALTTRLDNSSNELVAERSHVNSIHKRLRALQDDLKDYQDLKRVLDRGGDVLLKTTESVCPTCHQGIKDALLPQERSATPMTLDENIAFIRDQIATFVRMRRDAIEVLEAKEQQQSALSDRIHDVSQQIRALKKTLHSDGRVPSVAAVREHVALDEAADKLSEATIQVGAFIATLGQLSQEWVQVTGRLKALAGAELSDMDAEKLAHLEASFVEQLGMYKFSSFLIDHLSISRDSYRPTREGYDVGLTSASDTIRMIWAYLLGMLEVDRKFHTNHIGCLVFDEPRQQGTEKLSFDALLHRAAETSGTNQQVIFTTSEERELLEVMLESVECSLVAFEGKILNPL
jgi:tetrahydrodipicolinate N-succinyltransferase